MYNYDNVLPNSSQNDKHLDKFVEKIKRHVSFSITPPPHSENSAVYEIMWKYLVQPERPQMTVYALSILEMRQETKTKSM